MAVRETIAVAAIVVAAGLLVGSTHAAHAQQIYRGMNRDGANQALPQVANTALGLGVRPQDVVVDPNDNTVPPNNPNTNTPQGTSVVNANPCTLPAFTRPAGNNWNGTAGANVRVFEMAVANLPANLQVQPAPIPPPNANPNHAVISTAAANTLTLAQMQAAIGGTQAHWAIVAPPANQCP